tara:strand:- start:1531 stop:1965 length:435 start_codon:yes stop_codon:yes gene_type:complete
MAHFAELDGDNKVLRVLVACNEDVNNYGGDQSEMAANRFEKTVNLSFTGVKWIQTSYNDNFRQRFASTGMTYDPVNDVFIHEQPFASWSLDSEFEWQPPVALPSETEIYKNLKWDEDNQRWLANSVENSNSYYWDPSSAEFVLI